MPGYVIHLAEAACVLEELEKRSLVTPEWEEVFLWGIMLPDAVSRADKEWSHFRDPKNRGRVVVAPELTAYLKEHPIRLEDPLSCGYFTHLQLDRVFYTDYLPKQVLFRDKDGRPADRIVEVETATMLLSGLTVPRRTFFTEYLYEEYSSLNRSVMKRFRPRFPKMKYQPEGGLCGVPCANVVPELAKLREYVQEGLESEESPKAFSLETVERVIRETAADAVEALTGK